MTSKVDTDEDLVAEARGGSRDAFAELVLRYQNRAYATAIGVLADFELAQDVAQDACICAYRDLHKLENPARFGAWLSGIARYTALAARRERSKVLALAEQYRAEHPLVQLATPERAVETDERRRVVHRALERLSQRDREVLSLHYLEGLPYAGIAAALGTSETAVKGRMQRARMRLRKELKMVEERFSEAQLPEDFVARINALLGRAADDKSQLAASVAALGALGAEAVEPLSRALEDERKWVRHAAALALCEIGDPRALQPMLRALWTSRWIPQLEDGWFDIKTYGQVLAIPGMREAALQRLREFRVPESEGPLWAGERDHRSMRILSQASPDDDEIFDGLYEIFKGGDERLASRAEALEMLCNLGPRERAHQMLVEAVDSGEEALIHQACMMVSRWSGLPWWNLSDTALPLDICEQILANAPKWATCEMTAEIMCRHGEEGKARLVAAAHNGEPYQRAVAALRLARHGVAAGAEIMDRELLGGRREAFVPWTDPGDRMRGNVGRLNTWTLAKRYPEQAGPLIEEMYKHGLPQLKKAAVRILARQRQADFLPELRKCLGSGRPRYGEVAREAFWEMHRMGAAAEPTALEMLASDDWLERKAAVCLLRRWGKLTDAQRAKAQADEHVAVRQAAA